jgi:glycolate oxidase FAD binding subunit
LRWLCTDAPSAQVRAAADQAGGHATLFHRRERAGPVFAPLAPPLAQLHRRIKAAFDPDGVFNPGQMVPVF